MAEVQMDGLPLQIYNGQSSAASSHVATILTHLDAPQPQESTLGTAAAWAPKPQGTATGRPPSALLMPPPSEQCTSLSGHPAAA